MTKVIPQCAIQMAVYDSVKDFFQAQEPDKKLTSVQRLAAGGRHVALMYRLTKR